MIKENDKVTLQKKMTMKKKRKRKKKSPAFSLC